MILIFRRLEFLSEREMRAEASFTKGKQSGFHWIRVILHKNGLRKDGDINDLRNLSLGIQGGECPQSEMDVHNRTLRPVRRLIAAVSVISAGYPFLVVSQFEGYGL